MGAVFSMCPHLFLHYMIPKSIVSLLVAIFVNYPGQKKFVFKQ